MFFVNSPFSFKVILKPIKQVMSNYVTANNLMVCVAVVI